MNSSGILLAGMTGLFMLSMGYIIIFVLYQRRMISKDLEQQRLANEYQQKLLRSAIESQEAERQRIAHDLHDEIGTMLTTSKLYFNQLNPGQAEQKLPFVRKKLRVLFDDMLANVRRISHDLKPVVLENLGLIEAIESFREKLEYAGVTFNFYHQLSGRLSASSELLLYRILQELITNTVKHANASAITLRVTNQGKDLLISYSDNGTGFQAPLGSGLGLRGIETRVTVLNGRIYRTTNANGINVEIRIDADNLKHA